MIVPHVAIVSSFLLAGNNPNIWATATGRLHAEPQAPPSPGTTPSEQAPAQIAPLGLASLKLTSMFSGLWKLSYKGTSYRSAWLWDRGPCKAKWIAKYMATHPRLATALKTEVQDMGFEGWVISTFGVAVFLIVLPCFFAATIRYAPS